MHKTRRTFWIADSVTQLHRERALLLRQKGYDVQFFTSLDAVTTELESRRAAVIVVSDDGDERMTERILVTLMSLPEVQGARLVMVSARHSPRLDMLAACANFRDVIPIDIDEKQWLQRFVFATAGRPLPYVQPPGQLTLNNISAVALPARITWIGPARLRLECKARPPVGATLSLGGAFAEALGVDSVTLTVLETQRSHLLYRFSDAVVAEWSVPASAQARAHEVLAQLKAQDPGPRCRIFVAAKTTAVRNAILTRFDEPRFEISTALQKQSIVDEPRFFTPDVVFIEDALCTGEEEARFAQMLDNLTETVTVVIMGRVDDFTGLQRRYPKRRIIMLPRIPKNLSQSVLARHLPLKKRAPESEAERDALHVVAEHPFSLAELAMPARLHSLHPVAARLALPYPVSNFALLRLESPLLRKLVGRNPLVKLTVTHLDTHPDAGTFTHLVECTLSDLDQRERRALAAGLTRLATEALARFDAVGEGGVGVGGIGVGRTPELGSVRAIPVVQAPRGREAEVRRPGVRTASGEVIAEDDVPRGEVVVAGVVGGGGEAVVVPPPPPVRATASVAVVGGGGGGGGAAAPRIEAAPDSGAAPLIAPLVEAAQDLGFDVARAARKGAKKDDVRIFFKYVAFVAFMIAVLWAALTALAPHWSASGTVYSDQLKKFSGRE